jgi:putative ABC transport system permease protein
VSNQHQGEETETTPLELDDSMRGFLTDLKLAVRSLGATRWTSAAAVLILALGTGVNSAVLAVAYGILLRPLPYADPGRLVVIGPVGQDGRPNGVPAAEFEEWRNRLRTVGALAAYTASEFTIRGTTEPRVVRTALVKGDFFRLMGVPSDQGRLPGDRDTDWVVFSSRFARQLVNGGRLVGSSVTVGQSAYVVSSILPDRFTFPADDVLAWLPSSSRTAIGFGTMQDARSFQLVGRLRPGVTPQQASEDGTRVLRELRPASAGEGRRTAEGRVVALPLADVLTGRVRPVLGALTAAALLVLLVACGNVASLFIGRAARAQQDLAVRIALGATRWRIVRGVLAESLVVALAASAAGAWIGLALMKSFVGVAQGILPRLDAVAIDAPVLAAMAGVGFVVTMLCGALPALHAVRGDLAPAFRTIVSSSSKPARRLRAGLVALQIGLSVVLLAGAGLVVRTVGHLLDQATGFQPAGVVSLRLVMSDRTTFAATERTPFVRQIVERASRLPGVRAAGIGSALPPRVSPLTMGVTVNRNGKSEYQAYSLVAVTPGYLATLGARLVRGRTFSDADFDRASPVAVLSEAAAKHLSPTKDLVGSPLPFAPPSPTGRKAPKPEVVGIVGDIKYNGLDSTSAGSIYVLWPELPAGVGYLVVRANGDSKSLAGAVRNLVRDADPQLPIPDFKSLDDEVLASIADRRLRLVPAISFGVLALLVALVGLSAAMTRAVNERQRELAIRSALGASPGRTLRMVVGEGALVTAVGLALGLGAALAAARTLESLLFGVSPRDALTYSLSAALVAAGALAVSWAAGRRAARRDVMALLHTE